MKLVHLADYGGPYAGSFVPMLKAVLSSGRDRGYDPLAVFTDVARDRPWLAELRDAELPIRFVPRAEIGATVEDIAGDGACVLHSHFSGFDLAVARAARRHGAIAYWHIHTALHPGPQAWARNAVRFGLLSRGVREILCVAPQLARGVRQRLGPRRRVSFVPNAIDLQRFPLAGEEARRAARERLGLPPHGIVLLHFGWDWEIKGGDVFLAAAKLLREEQRDIVAVSVDGGAPAREKAAALGLADALAVLEPTDDVRGLYAAADVIVMPSSAEGMPFAITEALASGRPVVATDGPGQREIAAGLAACRLTDREPATVAAAAAALLDRPGLEAERDAQAARRSVAERLALPIWTERMLERYAAARAVGPSGPA